MLTELLELFAEDGDEDAYSMATLEGFLRRDSGVELGFSVLSSRAPGGSQSWSIACEQVLEVKIVSSANEARDHAPLVARSLRLLREHPLLWTFTEPWCSLYFRCDGSDFMAEAAALEARHRALASSWMQPAFGTGVSAAAMLAKGHGCLASGPRSLLRGYAESLEGSRVRTSIVEHPIRAEHDVRPVEVLLFDGSYVVGRGFTASGAE